MRARTPATFAPRRTGRDPAWKRMRRSLFLGWELLQQLDDGFVDQGQRLLLVLHVELLRDRTAPDHLIGAAVNETEH